MLINGKKNIAIISIMSYYARQIFDETKPYEFRKSPLPKELMGEKLYVYSAKDDKAIIGYFRVNNILSGNTNQILRDTGYNVRPDRGEIVRYYGENFPRCFALKVEDVTEFDEYLSLQLMRRITPDISMPQYFSFISEDHSLYGVITDWDEAFSLDGNVCDEPWREKDRIIKKAIGTR